MSLYIVYIYILLPGGGLIVKARDLQFFIDFICARVV